MEGGGVGLSVTPPRPSFLVSPLYLYLFVCLCVCLPPTLAASYQD